MKGKSPYRFAQVEAIGGEEEEQGERGPDHGS